jgi:DNA-binding ferritin-like protein
MIGKRLPSFVLTAFFLAFGAGCSQETKTGADKANAGLEKVKSLHRGELSAVSTYDQALAKVDKEALKPELQRLRDEHRDAADALAGRVKALGGQPDVTAGPWGDWTKAVQGAANLINAEATLMALKAGENHGIREYQEALDNPNVDSETKTLIRDRLHARQRAHVTTLENLKAAN